MDGIIEAHTDRQIDDYLDQPGYQGLERFNDHDKMVELIVAADKEDRQEYRLESIEFGKIANMTVFDCDFLHDDLDKVAKANVVATIIDGEEVYKA